MNDELLKAFENVINFYKTKPKFLDVVCTELFEKMTELDNEFIFNSFYPEKVNDTFIQLEWDECYKCLLCNRFSNDYYDHNGMYINLDEKTIQYMFPGNDDLSDKLIALLKDRDCVHICDDCCYRYHYKPDKKCFKFDVYTWINRIVERKPDKICESEEFLLNYYKFKNICKPEELFLSYYYKPKEEIPDYEKNLLNAGHKQGKIHIFEEVLLDYYQETGRIYEAKKLLEYRNLREIRDIEERFYGCKSEEISEKPKQSVTTCEREPDYFENFADIVDGFNESDSSEESDYEYCIKGEIEF